MPTNEQLRSQILAELHETLSVLQSIEKVLDDIESRATLNPQNNLRDKLQQLQNELQNWI